ncbi:MAG TPA: hypothetical protein VK151_12680 [Fluviicola sp.]|nr:hypothetical protein [Fluviicola sp.]
MKLSTSLLQAITIGVTLGTATVITSCEKEDVKTQVERNDNGNCEPGDNCPSECPACGMG